MEPEGHSVASIGRAHLDRGVAHRGEEGGFQGSGAGALRPAPGKAPPHTHTLTLAQLLGLLGSLFFLGQALTVMLVYVWSRRNPQVRVNFFGLLTFHAPFLPWALMGFSLLLGNSILVDLLGEPACAPALPKQAVWHLQPQAGCCCPRALPPTCTGSLTCPHTPSSCPASSSVFLAP